VLSLHPASKSAMAAAARATRTRPEAT